MTSDPFQAYKETQRDNWKSFAPLAMTTTPTAAKLVHFAGVSPNQKVLDVGCGTGVVAITARRVGAVVTGLDLTPELLAIAKENTAIAQLDDITWKEGDVPSDRATKMTLALSPQHYRHLLEQAGGPIVRLIQALKDDPARLAHFRRDYDELVSQYFDGNVVRQDFLMTRATKV